MPTPAVRAFVAIFVASFFAVPGFAQQPSPAAKTAPGTCPVRSVAPSKAEMALFYGEPDEAAKLFLAGEKEAGPEGDRAHNGYIRTLLAQNKLHEAEVDAQAWAKSQPASAWAAISLADVEFRQGRMDLAIPGIQTAGSLDRCNAEAHVLFARFSNLTGMNATAKLHIEAAHRFEPLDPRIGAIWTRYQPRAVRLKSLEDELAHPDGIPDKTKKALTRRLDYLKMGEHPCKLAAPIGTTSIPLHAVPLEANGSVSWTLVVSINGQDLRLEVDTGASGFLLYKGAATSLHLKPEIEFGIGGVGDEGAAKGFAAHVDSIKIGEMEFQNCAVDVAETHALAGHGDGLIGGDVFRQFLVTLDFPGHMMKLDPLPAVPGATATTARLDTGDEDSVMPGDAYISPAMKDWTPVLRSGHEILMPTVINNGRPHFMLVDTGADLSSLSVAAAQEIGKLHDSGMEVEGLSGQTKKTYISGQLMLHFAGLRFPSTGFVTFDTSAVSSDAGTEVSGFLGAGILRRLTIQIDYRDDLVKFNYDPKRLTPCMPGVYRADCYEQ